MPTVETYRKQAKLLLRWHREGNYSIGGRVRQLGRYRSLTDCEVLEMKFTLALAQEIVAVEAGHQSWTELKAAAAEALKTPRNSPGPPCLKDVIPILLVRDVKACATFFHEKLGFKIDFLHGLPPFYGSVSRDGIRLHLRFVHEPFFAKAAAWRNRCSRLPSKSQMCKVSLTNSRCVASTSRRSSRSRRGAGRIFRYGIPTGT